MKCPRLKQPKISLIANTENIIAKILEEGLKGKYKMCLEEIILD
jgi:hypothetical protein